MLYGLADLHLIHQIEFVSIFVATGLSSRFRLSSASSSVLSRPTCSKHATPVHSAACCSQCNNCPDLGRYSTDYLCSLTDERKYWLLTNAFRPTFAFKFPSKKEYGKTRSFQRPWLKEYPWLAYYRIFDGSFCVNCVLFAKGRLYLGQLVTTPMTCFTRAKQTLQEHNVQATHRVAMEDSAAYIGQMEDGHSSVEQQLQTQAFDVIQRNRAILRSILKAVIFCGRQNIALTGHCESKLATDEESKHMGNSWNFQALLRFGMDAGDQILREHLATAPRNAQYHSPTIQNDLIAASSQWIQKKIVQEVKDAKFFAVCADEAADAANIVRRPTPQKTLLYEVA